MKPPMSLVQRVQMFRAASMQQRGGASVQRGIMVEAVAFREAGAVVGTGDHHLSMMVMRVVKV